MVNNIVKIAVSIGVALFVPIVLGVAGGNAVWRWMSRKLFEKKKKPEIPVIEHLTPNDVVIHCEHHEPPSNAHSTSFANVATQTDVQQYPMESVRGLQNLGNTCYFDSTMQALVHTNLVFREKLENLGKKEEFVRNVLKFLSAMQLKSSKPYSPNDLHRMFGKKSPKFADHRQHDSHECLRNFLDNVRKEERDNSGAVDKRKVLTVVDSVFGGHFMTVYICKECETPYHVCEALLDISLPIMIDEKDLAAMKSARGNIRKKSRTVKLQTPKTDDTNKSKRIKSPMDKPNAGEDSIKPKPSKTEQDSKLDVALQQNTSDQALQLKSKTETTERHPTNINAKLSESNQEFDVGFTSNEPEAFSIQGKVTHDTEELQPLNDVVNLSPKNVDLENTSDGKTRDLLKESSLTIPRLFDPDTESGTFSLDDTDEKVEDSNTTLGTETDLEDNKKTKIYESDSETFDKNVESSTSAESNLAEKNDIANDPGSSQGYCHESIISVGTEDNKENEDHKSMKSDARDNPTEIEAFNEEQDQSSEDGQYKQQEQHGGKHSFQAELVQEQRNAEEKEGEQHAYNANPHPNIHDLHEIEGEQHFQNAKQDQHNQGIAEKYGQDFPNTEADEKQQKALEQHDGTHPLNVQPEKQQKDAEEQQNGQFVRNTEPRELGEENKDEQEEQQGVKDQEQQQELEGEERREHEKVIGYEHNEQEQNVEETQQKYDDENDGKKGEDDQEIDKEGDEGKDGDEEEKEDDNEQQNLNHVQELQEDGKEQNKQEKNVEQLQQKHDDENDDKEDDDENEDKKEEEEDDDDEQKLREHSGGKHLLNFQPEKQHKGAEERQSGQYIRNEENLIREVVGEEQREPEVEVQRRQDEQVEQEDEKEDEKEKEEKQELTQENVQVQEHEEQDREQAPRKNDNKEGDKENKNGEEKVVEVEAEVEYIDRKVVEEANKDNDDDDNKEVKDEKVTEEDDEEQIGQQKQELGEFEVVENASESKDRYRETVDKLMTPLSLSSPYLPSDETAIRKHVTIYDCLKYFTRKEHIHNEYLCNPCYAKHLANGGEDVLLTSATKQTMIFNPPAILTLHLKRFELKPGGSVKRTDMITYGELLDIAPYCSSMCLRNDPPCQNIWYSLYGVVIHHGSTLQSGHYTAYVKIKDNDAGFKKFLQEKYFDRDLTREQLIEMMQEKHPDGTHKQSGGTWYCMNDSWFDEVPVVKVLKQEAYLLFYERMS